MVLMEHIMKTRSFGKLMRRSIFLYAFALVPIGCASPKPTVIATMRNPTTGSQVELYKEIWYKVPADYIQAKHIEWWIAEQRAQGFTNDVAVK